MSDEDKAPYMEDSAQRKTIYQRDYAAYQKELKAYQVKWVVPPVFVLHRISTLHRHAPVFCADIAPANR